MPAIMDLAAELPLKSDGRGARSGDARIQPHPAGRACHRRRGHDYDRPGDERLRGERRHVYSASMLAANWSIWLAQDPSLRLRLLMRELVPLIAVLE
jgi:hypothetical protein